MKKLLIILVFAFVCVVSSNAQYYWVNGSGDWFDVQHWSDTTGGPAGIGVPNFDDDVVFDQNSTNSKGSIEVTIEGLASCKTISKNCPNQIVFDEGMLQVETLLDDGIAVNSQLIINNSNKGPDDPITIVTEKRDLTCYGDCDGWAKVSSLTGADPIVSYAWYNSGGVFISNQDSIGGLCVGTFTILITDGDGDLQSENVFINEPGAMVVNIADTTDVTCFGECDGRARVLLITGGVNPKTHSWSNGYTANGFNNNLCPGIYTDTITDKNGCKITKEFVIAEPDELTVSDSIFTPFICDGAGGGSIELDVVGGNQPPDLNYSIGSGYPDNNDGDFSLLAPGSYTVTVTDDKNCTLISGPYLLQANSAVTPTETHQDITCHGDDDGSIDVSVSGGQSPYTYSWAGPNVNGNSNQDLSSLEDGTYSLTVTDAASCTGVLSVIIDEPDSLTVNFDLTHVLCSSGNDGQIVAHVSGGTTAYDAPYSWSSGVVLNDSTITNLTAGNYQLTVTDANGCQVVDNADITEPDALSLTFELSNIQCNGGADGQIIAHVLGGTTAYNSPYSWSGGTILNDSTIHNLGTGNYEVTVTDANGCQVIDDVDIFAPTALDITFEVSHVQCNSGSDGQVIAHVTGGTPVYNAPYSWSAGTILNDSTIHNLSAGNYEITITDANGCQYIDNVDVNEPSALSISLESSDISCNGLTDGQIIAHVTGGTSVYNTPYSWSAGTVLNDSTIHNLPVGNYQVTVTDANGCQIVDDVDISEPNALSISLEPTHVLCSGGSDGQIVAHVLGGSEPYALPFVWSSGTILNDSTIHNLSVGNYAITVTDANGCQITDDVDITVPNPLNVNFEVTHVQCNGNSDGLITAHVTGGTPSYNQPYVWSGGTVLNDSTIHMLSIGNYEVTVTDANGCQIIDDVDITEPNALSMSFEVADVQCNGGADGQIIAHVLGGTTVYSAPYSWSSGTILNDSTIHNLSVGNYEVTVTDANGCQIVDNVDVNEPTALSLIFETTDVSCNGGSDGHVIAHVLGGTTTYTTPYSWSSGTVLNDSTIHNLSVGNYEVTVTDANGCEIIDNIDINEPDALSLSFELSPVSCHNGSDGQIIAHVLGGTTAYDMPYTWSGGTVLNDSTIHNLTEGNYSVTITDANNCQIVDDVDLDNPQSLSVSFEVNHVQCNGASDGQIIAHVSGGVPAYVGPYTWSGGTVLNDSTIHNLSMGNYQVTITDANGCQISDDVDVDEPEALSLAFDVTDVSCNGGSNGQVIAHVLGGTTAYNTPYSWSGGTVLNDSTIHNLSIGNYEVTVTDANGCQIVDNIDVNQPTALSINLEATDVSCNGGSDGQVIAHVLGGTVAYNAPYVWSTGTILNDSTIHNLPIGNYEVIVTDANGCQIIDDIDIAEPTALSLSLEVTNVSCNGGSDGQVIAHVLGGTEAYNTPYSWSSGTVLNDSTIHNLPIGNYEVTITDANGCQINDDIDVIEPDALSLSFEVTNVSCNGGSDGQVIAHVLGGTTAYSAPYSWSSGIILNDSTIHNLPVGNYEVTVTDANACQIIDDVDITEPAALSINLEATDISCNGGSNGQIIAHVQGGTMNYDVPYAWSAGTVLNDSTIHNLPIGNYEVTVTDANDCEIIDDLDIVQPLPLSVDLVPTHVSCYGDNDGQIIANVSGGALPYQNFHWSTGDDLSVNTIADLPAGDYSVTVTDANDCEIISETITIDNGDSLYVNFTNITQVFCPATCVDSATAIAGGGSGNYTYEWANLEIGTDAFTLCKGYNIITITDIISSCVLIDSVLVLDSSYLDVSIDTVMTPACFGDGNGEIQITVNGDFGPYTYAWEGPDGYSNDVEDIDNLFDGVYYLTVSYGTGDCDYSAVFDLQEPDSITTTLNMLEPISCAGDCDAEVELNIQGGTAPYTINWSNGDQGTIADSLCSGPVFYDVEDNHGCTHFASYTIAPTLELSANIAVLDSLSCFGDCDASLEVVISGGTAPFTYLWSTTDTLMNVDSLCEGVYGVTVIDAQDCSDNDEITVNQPDLLSLNNISTTNVLCGGDCSGTSVMLATGGTGITSNYIYTWPDGQSAADLTQIDTLCAGFYEVTVSDEVGCEASSIFEIEDVSDLEIDSITSTPISCFEDCDGTYEVNAIGGTEPYDFEWSNGDLDTLAEGLCDQVYYVTVTDANDCMDADTIHLQQPDEISISFDVTEVSCYNEDDGVIEAIVEGGTETYTYEWSNDSTQNVMTGLNAGDYTLDLEDANGCLATAVAILENPDSIIIVLEDTIMNLCFGDTLGTIMVSASGGQTGYTFTWNDDLTSPTLNDTVVNLANGIYTVTVTDDNACFNSISVEITSAPEIEISILEQLDVLCHEDSTGFISTNVTGGDASYTYTWSHGDTIALADSLWGANYSLTVTDGNNCTDTIFTTILDTSNLMVQLIDSTLITCHGLCDASYTLNGNGGAQPYEYEFYNNLGQQQTTEIDNDSTFVNICSGVFVGLIRDANDCEISIPIEVDQPEPIALDLDSIDVKCFEDSTGEVSALISGGLEPYTFVWTQDGDTLNSSLNVQNIPAGLYHFNLRDSLTCYVVDSIEVLGPDSALLTTIEVSDTSYCRTDANTELNLIVSGGTQPYTYLWSNDSTTEDIDQLIAGEYFVTVTDNNLCETMDTANVIPKVAFDFGVSNDTIMCPNDTLQIFALANNPQWNTNFYHWLSSDYISDSLEQNPMVFPIESTYFYLAVDSICKDTMSVYVEIFDTVGIDAGQDETILKDQIVQLEATYHDSIVNYLWSPSIGLSSDNIYDPVAGPKESQLYLLRIETVNGCFEYDTLFVNVIPELVFPTGFTPNGDGINDTWEIDYIYKYPNVDVEIYNRWGEKLFHSKGYSDNERWDGIYKGEKLPVGTYYYIVKLNDGIHENPITGPITIVR